MNTKIHACVGHNEPKEEVEATLIEGGLAIIKVRTREEWTEDDGWSVTHVNTGLGAAQGFYSETTAKLALKWLLTKADWTFDELPEEKRSELYGWCRFVLDTWKDVGRPVYRESVYDRLDENFDGYVIGLDYGVLYVADLKDDVVVGFGTYSLIHPDMVQETDSYHNEVEVMGPDDIYWICEDYIAHFYVGMKLGNELDPVPFDNIFDLDEDDAHTWAGSYSYESLNWCDTCDMYFDGEYHGRYVEAWGDVVCESCFDNLVDQGRLCRDHAEESCDECAEDEDEDEYNGMCTGACGHNPCGNEPRLDNSMAMSSSDERYESNAGKNEHEWDKLNHDEKKAALDARINTVLAECNPNLPMYVTE